MKILTSGKLFTFKGITYQVKKCPKVGQIGCWHCNKFNTTILFGNAFCNYCSYHLDYNCYPSRVYKKDETDIEFHIKDSINSIRSMETMEVIERLKRFGSFTANGVKSEYWYMFKKPIPVTLPGFLFNAYTKVKEVVYRPAFEGGPIYTVGLYSKYDDKEQIGETIITECVSKFCPGDTIKIALAIK